MIRRILLVEADQILRAALEKRLAVYSDYFRVSTAADGLEAVKKIKDFSFSLIVADLTMPRMDGMSLLAHIREKYPDLPVIVLLSKRPGETQHIVRESGILACLTQPFLADELVSLIMSSLRSEADGGIMYDVSPTVFLQLMEMESKTCTIRIFDKVSEAGGVLYFIDGRLVDARVGDLRGIDAAYRVFTWEAVTLFIHNQCNPRKNIIDSDLQPIIMTAVGMKDESESPDLAEDDEDDDPAPRPADRTKAGAEAGSAVHNLETFLRERVGENCGLDGCSFDGTLGDTIDSLNELGTVSGFGKFQAGYAATGKKHDRIILPGRPPPVLTMDPGCARDRIIDTLRNLEGKLPSGQREES
jgi:DNA-binding response OmpR family regulator